MHAGGGTSITNQQHRVGRVNNNNRPGGRARGHRIGSDGQQQPQLLTLAGRGRKRRKNYPLAWGCSPEQMRMKRRVLCVYDGPQRLCKDDMLLDRDFEVRLRLGDGPSYTTDLDILTLQRAEACHAAVVVANANANDQAMAVGVTADHLGPLTAPM